MEAYPGCPCGFPSAVDCWDNQNNRLCNCECLHQPEEDSDSDSDSDSNSEEE